MLNELLKVLENVIIIVFLIGAIGFWLYMIKDMISSKHYTLKKCLCFLLYAVLSVYTLINIAVDIFKTAWIWKMVEEEQTVVPWLKTFSYVNVILFNVIVYFLCLFVIYYVYNHQILSGKGSVKNKLKYHYGKFKESMENEHRRKRRIKKDKKEIRETT